MASAIINVPPRARRGEIIEIKTLISHPMETGYRRTQLGTPIPRDIIRSFVCTYNGTEVFRAELHPASGQNQQQVIRPPGFNQRVDRQTGKEGVHVDRLHAIGQRRRRRDA